MINSNENKKGYRSETINIHPIFNIVPMENHPFQVKDDEEMERLMESIREYGVLNPIIVRFRDGYYEIVSGHRRFEACRRLNKSDIPVIVRDLSDDEAILTMVDSNLHREKLLPSEKAFAYKMKLNVLKKQGQRTDLTSAQVAPKLRSDEVVAEEAGESRATIQRFVRLTNLIKPLLDMVDAGKIALTPAEKLSYLKKEEQETLAMTLEDLQVTPSLSQAIAMKDHSSKGVLGIDEIYAIMEKPKANQKEVLKFKAEPFRKYFPDETPKDIEKELLKIIEEWKQLKQEKALRVSLRERGDDRER